MGTVSCGCPDTLHRLRRAAYPLLFAIFFCNGWSYAFYTNLNLIMGERVAWASLSAHVVARRQLSGVHSLLLPVGPWDRTQVVRLGSEYIYPLSHLPSPRSTPSRAATRREITLQLHMFMLVSHANPMTQSVVRSSCRDRRSKSHLDHLECHQISSSSSSSLMLKH